MTGVSMMPSKCRCTTIRVLSRPTQAGGRGMQRRFRLVAVLVGSLSGCQAGLTATPEAWQAFRAEVASACVLAAGDELVNPVVTVDPFGSDSYGLAVLCGPAAHDGKIVYRICVLDKRTRHVELGGELKTLAFDGCR
jgi:hypothetical protein